MPVTVQLKLKSKPDKNPLEKLQTECHYDQTKEEKPHSSNSRRAKNAKIKLLDNAFGAGILAKHIGRNEIQLIDVCRWFCVDCLFNGFD